MLSHSSRLASEYLFSFPLGKKGFKEGTLVSLTIGHLIICMFSTIGAIGCAVPTGEESEVVIQSPPSTKNGIALVVKPQSSHWKGRQDEVITVTIKNASPKDVVIQTMSQLRLTLADGGTIDGIIPMPMGMDSPKDGNDNGIDYYIIPAGIERRTNIDLAKADWTDLRKLLPRTKGEDATSDSSIPGKLSVLIHVGRLTENESFSLLATIDGLTVDAQLLRTFTDGPPQGTPQNDHGKP